jgi:YD repeat-containing protein
MKKALIAVVIVLLVAGGAGAAYYFMKKDKNSSQQTAQNTQTSTPTTETTPPSFDALSVDDMPRIATVETEKDGKTSTLTLSYDGHGNAKTETMQGGKAVTFYYTKNAYYMCSGSKCYKYKIVNGSTGDINPDDYQYGKQTIENFRNSAVYKGQQDCPTGICDAWEMSSAAGTTTLLVNPETKRVIKVVNVSAGATTTIVFNYKDVSIEIPENAQELPAGI